MTHRSSSICIFFILQSPNLIHSNIFFILCFFSRGEKYFWTKVHHHTPNEVSSLVEDIHVKTREASQNTDLDMREFLDIDKGLQSIQGELLSNTSKLAEMISVSKRYQKVGRSKK